MQLKPRKYPPDPPNPTDPPDAPSTSAILDRSGALCVFWGFITFPELAGESPKLYILRDFQDTFQVLGGRCVVQARSLNQEDPA